MINFVKKEKEPKEKKTHQTPHIQPDVYTLCFSDEKVYIFNKHNKDQYLEINRMSSQTYFEKMTDFKEKQLLESAYKFFVIFGKVEFKKVEFLILVSKAELAADFDNRQIYLVKNVRFLTINPELYKQKISKCWEHLEKLKYYLKSGFYFSYNYPLHLLFQNKILKMNVCNSFEKNIFTWNLHSLKFLLKNQQLDFFYPVIQGYVGQIQEKNLNFNFVLISRRSFYMGGTRYNSRGIDNKGYVANFVESEQLLISNTHIISYNQIRGSLPFYWSQEGLKAKIKIGQTLDINVDNFQKHISFVKKNMMVDKIYFFNLLGEKRGDEPILTNYLFEVLKEAAQKGVEGVFYKQVDFHGITKETDYSNVDKHIYTLYGNDDDFNYFEYEVFEDDYVQHEYQKNMIRTNCLDCLDRTNAVQTKLSFFVLYLMLKKLKLIVFNSDIDSNPLQYLEKSKDVIVSKFRKLWADNGDNIARIYAGTGATTSSVTRKGEKSGFHSFLDHGYKTISRFYLNNFDDDFKQEIIDALINKKHTSIRHSMTNIDKVDNSLLPIGFFSVVSCENPEMIQIPRQFFEDMFSECQDCFYIFFFAYIPKNRNIRVVSDDYIVFQNFSEIFKNMKDLLQGFEILRLRENNNFEVILLGNTNKDVNLSYYKEEKAKISLFKTSLGVKTSFIFNEYSLEFFALDLDEEKVESQLNYLLDKYIDKYYDMIIITGNLGPKKLDEDIHQNYKLIFNNILNFENNKKRSNQINLLFSKKMMEKDLEPNFIDMDFTHYDIDQQLVINSTKILLHFLN